MINSVEIKSESRIKVRVNMYEPTLPKYLIKILDTKSPMNPPKLNLLMGFGLNKRLNKLLEEHKKIIVPVNFIYKFSISLWKNLLSDQRKQSTGIKKAAFPNKKKNAPAIYAPKIPIKFLAGLFGLEV